MLESCFMAFSQPRRRVKDRYYYAIYTATITGNKEVSESIGGKGGKGMNYGFGSKEKQRKSAFEHKILSRSCGLCILFLLVAKLSDEKLLSK